MKKNTLALLCVPMAVLCATAQVSAPAPTPTPAPTVTEARPLAPAPSPGPGGAAAQQPPASTMPPPGAPATQPPAAGGVVREPLTSPSAPDPVDPTQPLPPDGAAPSGPTAPIPTGPMPTPGSVPPPGAGVSSPGGVASGAPMNSLMAPRGSLDLNYGNIFMEDSGRSIADEISIELLDVNSIMKILDDAQRDQLVRMSLEDCIQVALAQNTDIQIAALDPLIADADIKAARGEFDPVAQMNGVYTQAEISLSAQQIVFGGITAIRSYTTNLDAQVGGKLHTGTIWAVAGTMEKSEDTFGNFIEEFNTQMTMTLTQPLLRGFGIKYNRVRIKAAQNNRLVSEQQLRLTAMNTVSQIIKAYWDLVGAVESVAVNQGALDNAQRLLEVNQTRREIGTAADIEVLSAKGGVATRQSELIRARALVGDASDRLKQLMNLTDGEAFSRMLVVPTDRPNIEDPINFDPEVYEQGVKDSTATALEKRPEIAIAELQLQNAELDEYRAQRELMPQFDITGSYTSGGRDHKLSETLYGIRDRENKIYSYGFQAAVPIGNRAARGQYERSKLQKRQVELQAQRAKTDVMATVGMALRNVLTNKTLVESNEQAVRLQRAEVSAEESRLRLGVTTSWQVLQVQEQLTAAETAKLQAEIAYEKAVVDLQTAEGSLLDKLEITIEAPENEGQVGYWKSLQPRWD